MVRMGYLLQTLLRKADLWFSSHDWEEGWVSVWCEYKWDVLVSVGWPCAYFVCGGCVCVWEVISHVYARGTWDMWTCVRWCVCVKVCGVCAHMYQVGWWRQGGTDSMKMLGVLTSHAGCYSLVRKPCPELESCLSILSVLLPSSLYPECFGILSPAVPLLEKGWGWDPSGHLHSGPVVDLTG